MFQGPTSYRIFRSCLRNISDFSFSSLNVMSFMSSGILALDSLADGQAEALPGTSPVINRL